jgi:hypothetical protein
MRTKQNWPQVIADFHQSGLNKVAFCKDRGVSYQSFLMHLKRSEGVESKGFEQIVLGSDLSPDRIDYHWADGRCVSFPVSTPKDTIRFLIGL